MPKFLKKLLICILSIAIAASSAVFAACDVSFVNGFFPQENRTASETPFTPENPGDETGSGEDGESGNTDDPDSPESGEGETEEPSRTLAEFPDYVYFAPYYSEFTNAKLTGSLRVTSEEMLIAYIDYVNFYEVSTAVQLTVTYAASFSSALTEAQSAYSALPHFLIGYSATTGSAGKMGRYYIKEGDGMGATVATLTLDPEKEAVHTQCDYALQFGGALSRESDYDGFYVNSLEKTVAGIQNSEQLRWVLQSGYRPVCVAGSAAENVYEKAKAVLRKMVSDDMSDMQKARVIYEWLALNVCYDQYAYKNASTLENFTLYDTWYADGVFNHGKAVCEGYAKAFVIMMGIENIPAEIVTGNGHAWNRVCIDNVWYVCDATHADVQVSETEVFSYKAFAVTDAEKARLGYSATEHPDHAAVTAYNVFADLTFTYKGETFDLIADSAADFRQIVEYAKSLVKTVPANGCTVEMFVPKTHRETEIKNWVITVGTLTRAVDTSKLLLEQDGDGNWYLTVYLK